jgi:hypothetical protein
MGDGQHGWAAAEWIMMMRNCFVREESDRLIVGSGLFDQWFDSDDDLCFGPTLTPWGAVSVRIERTRTEPMLRIEGAWRNEPPRIDVAISGYPAIPNVNASVPVALKKESADFANTISESMSRYRSHIASKGGA